MFSNFFAKLGLGFLALSFVVLTGCDSKVGEEPPPPDSHEFSGTQCLSDAKPVLKDFVQGNAANADLEKTWDCVASAIQKFKRYVRGRSADRYTSQELANFLEKNFLDRTKENKISVPLQVEFMKLKQVFIGGSAESISRDEIDKLIVLIGNFRSLTVSLNPYMKVIALNWSISESDKFQMDVRYFEDANKEIQNASHTLASLIEQNGQGYRLSDFVSLTRELSNFFGENWTFPATIAKYMPIIQKVKKALAGGDEDLITPQEWSRFSLLGARGYVQYLRYYYFIKSVPETGSGYRLSYLSRTVEDVLSVFQDLVATKPEGVVSRQEVTDLLKTLNVVWPEFKVSDNLVFESMKVKQLFFGGSVDSFTTSDFERARLKVSRIKILIERFLPYYTIFGREWVPDIYEPEEAQKLFMESQFVLESTVREAGGLFEGSYDLNDAVRLAHEVELLYPSKGESLEDQAKKYLPLVVDVKNMILGGNDSTLRKSHWSTLLGFVSRFYSDFLYYDYFVKEHPVESPATVGNVSVLMNQTLNILRDILVTKPENRFSRLEVNKLVQHLIRLEMLPVDLKAESVDQVIGVVLNNVLVSPEQRLAGVTPNCFDVKSIEVLRQELQIWLDAEFFISTVTQNWKPDEGVSQSEVIELLMKAQKNQNTSPALQTALTEMLMAVQSPVPLTNDSQGRVNISGKITHIYTLATLKRLNLTRILTRVLTRSFVMEKERIVSYKGATLGEVQTAFLTLKPILVEMGLIEEKNNTFADSRFREANIFVPHSDGNTLASFAEINDLIGMIFSGLKINTQLRESLIKDCFNGNDQVNNNTLVSLSCVRGAYKSAMPSVMTSLPEYLKFMQVASKDEWAYYMNNIFKAAGYVPNSKNMARIEDISLAPHVIQYIEMVFARFDKNKDGAISTPEALKAFPAFKGILLELAKDQLRKGSIKESDLPALFTYILRYGKPPETLREKIRFVLKWKGQEDKWDVWADRTQLAQILGYIADQVNKAPKTGGLPQLSGVIQVPSETQVAQ